MFFWLFLNKLNDVCLKFFWDKVLVVFLIFKFEFFWLILGLFLIIFKFDIDDFLLVDVLNLFRIICVLLIIFLGKLVNFVIWIL